MPVRSAASVRAEVVGAGKGTTRQVLIGPDEGPNFALRRFVMEPGGGMPPHTNTFQPGPCHNPTHRNSSSA